MDVKVIVSLFLAISFFVGIAPFAFSDSGFGTVESSILINDKTTLTSNSSETVAFVQDERWGLEVVNVGDLDGNGVPDILISRGDTTSVQYGETVMLLFLMESNGDIKEQRKITYDEAGLTPSCYDSSILTDSHGFGEKMTYLGPLSDGKDPVVMAAAVDENNRKGNIYALSLKYYSDSTLSPVSSCSKIAENVGGFNPLPEDNYYSGGTFLGFPILNAGDLNNDNVDDIYVGSDDGHGTEVYIFYLQQNSTNAITVKEHKKLGNIYSEITEGSILNDMELLDVDSNPSTLEILFSASGNFGGTAANKVFVGGFNDDFTTAWNQTISDDAGNLIAGNPGNYFANDEFGESILNIGDLDGDGTDDLVVAAENDSSDKRELGLSIGPGGPGTVYVLFMNDDGTVKSFQKISNLHGNLTDGTLTNDFWINGGSFGSSLDKIDLDGDGKDELLVTDMDYDGATSNSGALYIIELSDEEAETAPEITLLGANPQTISIGSLYSDPGATAYDPNDGDLSDQISVNISVDTTKLGTGTVTYSVTDTSGLTTVVTRNVTIEDAYYCGKLGSQYAKVLVGDNAKNTLSGGNNADLIFGYGGNDVINGNRGADCIFGGSGNDTLYGNRGSDYLYGELGNDILYGGKGKDGLAGGAGADTFDGGDGSDICDYLDEDKSKKSCKPW